MHRSRVPSAVAGYASGDDLTKQEIKFADRRGLDAETYRQLRQRIASRRDVNEEVTKERRTGK